ncbi:hypothetical protein FC20_GL000968 [Lactobacillus equicursoris DSM 19284 = JCM 14600 = CIP 110162]|uniref:Uncharacterized protein n=1 Tax=Lactobacillus equicursoris DSM 19284 = JCM 14600 = CIP 110162 TaxID=1293597 RepID=A0A0R1M6H9_9LACO|nr:hypothetical protein FC20_GL000968 [Lactobacillus equicursoris DSM 19284 = JCM 14600 = CIP 110162]
MTYFGGDFYQNPARLTYFGGGFYQNPARLIYFGGNPIPQLNKTKTPNLTIRRYLKSFCKRDYQC